MTDRKGEAASEDIVAMQHTWLLACTWVTVRGTHQGDMVATC